MKPADIQSFLPQKPQRLRTVEEPKRQQLVQATYDVVGCLHDVYRQLGPGLPEYIYQEALAKSFTAKGLTFTKEQEFHPLFMGQPLEAYLKMDLYGAPSVNRTKCLRWGERDHPSTPYQNEILVHVSRIDHARLFASHAVPGSHFG